MANLFRNYPEDRSISTHLLDFLWAELAVARGKTGHELWLVSPWISESSFDLSRRGEYTDFWPGYSRSSIPLTDILTKFLDFGTTLNIVCKPPHSHISVANIQRYSSASTTLAGLGDLANKASSLAQELKTLNPDQTAVKNELVASIDDIRAGASDLHWVLGDLRKGAAGHRDVLDFLRKLTEYRGSSVRITYNYRLHAKIIAGDTGAFLGSANVTHSGFNFNDEVYLYTAEAPLVDSIRNIARLFATAEYWWRKPLQDYSVWPEARRQVGGDKELKKLLSEKMPNDLVEAIELLGLSYGTQTS